MKILNFIAISLSLVQFFSVGYFLLKYQSDNLPFFILLIAVSIFNILALIFNKKNAIK